jgi:hypothetical protein
METHNKSPRTSRLAIASVISSCLLFLFGGSPLGVVLGVVSLYKIKRSEGCVEGKALAFLGIIIGTVGGLFFYSAWTSAVIESIEARRRLVCRQNVENLQLAIRYYALNNDNHFPPQNDWQKILARYGVENKSVFACPNEKKEYESYVYLGDSWMTFPENNKTSGIPIVFESRARHPRKLGNNRIWVAFLDGTVGVCDKKELETAKRQFDEWHKPAK